MSSTGTCDLEIASCGSALLEVFIRTAAIGRSSWRVEVEVHQCESGDLLARAEQVMVLIERAARLPTQVPDSWRASVEAFEGSA